jgi:hypothetical protein
MEKTIKSEFISQYAHTWRAFEGIVRDFDRVAWIQAGCGKTTPARIAFHIVKGVKYYIEDSSMMNFASGKSFENNWESVKEAELPSQEDVLICIQDLKAKTEAWLSEMDFNSENKPFPWAGKIRVGVVLFLLRHNLYHIGELSSLLNETKNGKAEDNWVKTL